MRQADKNDPERLRRGQNYARKKRKQADDDWKDENLEFGIKIQKPNILKKKN